MCLWEKQRSSLPHNDTHAVCMSEIMLSPTDSAQISLEPGCGAHQSLAQKIKVPFSRIVSFFLQFGGFEGNFKTRAKPLYAPNSGLKRFPKWCSRTKDIPQPLISFWFGSSCVFTSLDHRNKQKVLKTAAPLSAFGDHIDLWHPPHTPALHTIAHVLSFAWQNKTTATKRNGAPSGPITLRVSLCGLLTCAFALSYIV